MEASRLFLTRSILQSLSWSLNPSGPSSVASRSSILELFSTLIFLAITNTASCRQSTADHEPLITTADNSTTFYKSTIP
jgi:hypothetical protein